MAALQQLTIIVPCYNEQEVLPESSKELLAVVRQLIDAHLIAATSRLLFVDDGSHDRTWSIIQDLEATDPIYTGIKFSRNCGHQNALMAGMTIAYPVSDMIITIDADLQDDVQAIPKMVQQHLAGFDVVYGVRSSRDTDTFFKRDTALAFYNLMRHLGVDMVPNHADYRLLSKRALGALLSFRERNMFLRGIVPLVGYPATKVYYARKPRYAGTSKYPLKKMLAFALDGITSFSIIPIRMILNLGILSVVGAIIVIVYSLIQNFRGNVIPGWTSLMTSIWFISGVQLIAISIIGEYIGKIFTEVKHRPRYIIQEDDFTSKVGQSKSLD
ncbi:glycosyltransferase family 2 protein [Lactiplantibacillus mudanjiangensis]|uniref:Glycosyltransferase [Lactobacillus coryniformis subsp. coryniformis KCTC 3167 = DSM] n=1 Tax=Lactiplantibacillus mudanjiangensis TaxID=1296538 RepID=A0A660DXB0_9LACO|nr:glycosyltransferase family 2 protein [Lactiplantibacillus mudanjiangensis]VDG17934.1 glycosyltransferase [Lactobacillus coryniformis subsp. coryniformis KCTC 3167 = DSM] [Lactiplantibacillus mudanjiangensis]VDG24361.1 glycosyltransferase [Lactobacillus coryniformis subsp. coryniformis KCTC 3167 = DSM] [Lactiplantibacillus mudanjiangensis]VDG28348.1 glycosyltransferase [Lactobacillus coryniformis subsp. coryniformis KCTC 3167 = DSM] [Lactiplantibacillus mudanjiangensis]VDG32363.1 glycosyltran